MTPKKRRELTDDRDNENYQNGRISLREFVMAIMESDITRIEGVATADAKRLEDCIDSEVKRLESVILSEAEKTRINTNAIRESMVTADSITKERLESHNKFREQIEKERADLVRKDDLIRVEEASAAKFAAMAEKTDTAFMGATKAIHDSEERRNEALRLRDAALENIRAKQDNIDGWRTAVTVALSTITIGFTGFGILLYFISK